MYDFHTHFIPENVLTWLKDNKNLVNAKWIDKGEGKSPFLIVNEKWGFYSTPDWGIMGEPVNTRQGEAL